MTVCGVSCKSTVQTSPQSNLQHVHMYDTSSSGPERVHDFLKLKKIQLSAETRQESDELATQHRQPHDASVRDGSVVMWESAEEFRVWCLRSSCRSRCSWTTCWGFQSHCLLLGNKYFRVNVVLNNYLFALQLGWFVWIPELVRDWHDFDFPMSVMRLAAAIQPSLEVLRLRTNLHDHKTHTQVRLQ